jgi:3-keto-L-gulonate-6-phosphate decarboxylase
MMPSPDLSFHHAASAQVRQLMRDQLTFQVSVDTDNLPQGLLVAEAAVAAGVTIVEMGTPLIKCEGTKNVVPALRKRFPEALLLADMKTMDGGGLEARVVFGGGGNIIDFLALSGPDTAKAICKVRDMFRESDPETPRLVFADILLPHHGPQAVEVAHQMVDIGVDGVGVHLQLDARKADPDRVHLGYLAEIVRAVYEKVSDRVSVQVVGGISVEQACILAREGIRAFVISGNLGFADGNMRLGLPQAEIQQHISTFMQEVRGAAGGQ